MKFPPDIQNIRVLTYSPILFITLDSPYHTKVIMRRIVLIGTIAAMGIALFTSCRQTENKSATTEEFSYQVDRFEDISVLKYRLPGFEQLSLQEKELIYYLSEAALCGRDIFWDQNFRYNLVIRKTVEAVIDSYKGDRETEEYRNFIIYAKRIFFANGIHHHYSNDKFVPGFTAEYFATLLKDSNPSLLPLSERDER